MSFVSTSSTSSAGPRRIAVPGISRPIGAGDLIKRLTTAVGVQPCAPCEERAQRLNQRLVFGPRSGGNQ